MSGEVNSGDQTIMITGQSVRLAVKVRNWLPSQAEWIHAAQCVQVEEKERIGKFLFKRDSKSAMVGRLLMRFSLSKILGVPSRTLLFKRSEKGKPYLVSPVDRQSTRCDVSFNVSHQGDYVVFAAERGSPLGVDVMKVEWPRKTPVSSFFKTMHRQYSDQEWAEVKRYTEELDQLKVFYRLWCLKESVVKAYGTGIGFEVSRLNFMFGCQDVPENEVIASTKVEIDGDPAPEWTFEESFLDGHCIAVAVNHSFSDDQHSADPDATSQMKTPSFQVVDMQEVLAGCEPLTGNSPDHQTWQIFDSREEEPTPS